LPPDEAENELRPGALPRHSSSVLRAGSVVLIVASIFMAGNVVLCSTRSELYPYVARNMS